MSDPVSAPTPSPERRWVCAKPGWMGPCSPSSTHHNDDWGCGWSYPWTSSAPSPDPRSPEDGRGAPTPFETFQAGMFAGIMAERVAGRDPQDWTEGEVRREFRDWLEERAAATPANGATR